MAQQGLACAELGLTPRPGGLRSQSGWGEHSKALLVLLAARRRGSDRAACPHRAWELLTQTWMIWEKKWLRTSGILCPPGALPSTSGLMVGTPRGPQFPERGCQGSLGALRSRQAGSELRQRVYGFHTPSI